MGVVILCSNGESAIDINRLRGILASVNNSEVEQVITYDDLLERLSGDAAAVVIVSSNCIELSGGSAMRYLRQCCPGTKIIVTATDPQVSEAVSAIQQGADDYVDARYLGEKLPALIQAASDRAISASSQEALSLGAPNDAPAGEQGPSASPALRPDARQAQRSQQTIITNLLQQALRDVELNVLFDETVMLLNQQFDVDYCGVFELLSYQQGFVLKAGKGWPEGAVGQFVTPIDLNSAVGYRLLSGEPVLMGALQKDDRAESLLAYPPEINSFLSVLISGASHQPLGYIGLASRQGHQFTEDDAIFLRAVANVIAMAMERKRSEQSIRAHIQELACMTTVLAKTNDKLAERNRELNEFAYIASHDLKAPLRAIANLSEWIEEDLQDRPEPGVEYYMRLLRKRVFRIESLLNGLLQYSRIGRTQIEAESVATRAVVAEVVDLLDPPTTFTVVVGDNMPTLRTRRLPLQQTFSSLISNAIKHHNSPSGCVEITAKRLENFYEFTVADNGPGIAPEHHEKIFSIFQVLEPRDKTENTGVGLAIARKIVEAEGGKISLESELGQGATFKFTWPVQ